MLSGRKYLTADEVELLLTATQKSRYPERDYCLIYMCFIHGFRVSEALSLQLSDFSLKEKRLFINRLKHGFCTTHPLLDEEVRAIQGWLEVRRRMAGAESGWLFLSRNGKPISRQWAYRLIRRMGEEAGIAVGTHPHMLRHACGYALADRGIDTRLIQDYLGHRNIRHTVMYTASNAGRFEGVWRAPPRQTLTEAAPFGKVGADPERDDDGA